jgi:putative ABC transport system ATP-binding protein
MNEKILEMKNNEKILEMKNLVKTYQMGDEEQVVLKGIDLTINRGDFLSVLGPSGSGKSTLMNIIGCLDVPTSGSYFLSGEGIQDLSEAELSHIRNREIGFIFQQFQLLPRLSAQKNVELPLIYAGVPDKERHQRSAAILERVGLREKMKNRPNQLSGGQQQRVAIARALVTQPTILLADEPTGALDQQTGHQIMNLFKELHSEGKTIVMITHDANVAQNGSRIVRIIDGNLSEGVYNA